MADDVFVDPDESSDEWVDVRMVEPEQEEWDIDLIVGEGQVEYVDLRLQSDLLVEFVHCLLEDLSAKRTERILTDLVERADANVQDPGE